MCRAVYAVVIAAEEAVARLRRAAGLEVQIVGVAGTLDAPMPDGVEPDVLIVHDSADAASPPPGPAVVWVGEAAPGWADHVLADDDGLAGALPGAITRALIARRSRR